MANEPFERTYWQILIWRLRRGYYRQTLHPLENFNLAINSQIRQIKTTAKFPRYTVCTYM